MSSVIILGGGISGLSAAHYLLKFGKTRIKQITLTEASGYLGGCIKSTRFDDGAVYESGPRSVRPVGEPGKTTLALLEDLKLESEVIAVPRTHPATRNRMLLVNDKLHPLPAGLSPIFRTTPPFSRPLLVYALRDIFKKREVMTDDSIYNFAERRFGKEIADMLVDPLCRGVFAGDAKKLSVKTLLANFFEAEQKHGSVIKGILNIRRSSKNTSPVEINENTQLSKRADKEKWAMWNFKSGLQTLPETLVQQLSEAQVDIRKNNSCRSVNLTNSGVEVFINETDNALKVFTDGGVLKGDHLMSAIPAFGLSQILKESQPELSKELATIPTVTVAVVTLEYPQPVSELLKQQGFGFLVPSSQPYPILGIVYDSCSFPEHDRPSSCRFTVMMGGSWFEKTFGNPESVTDGRLLETAEDAIHKHLNILIRPVRSQVSLYKNSIPQHIVGHYEKVTNIRNEIERLSLPISLLGSSYDGIGINNCILTSKQMSKAFVNKLDKLDS